MDAPTAPQAPAGDPGLAGVAGVAVAERPARVRVKPAPRPAPRRSDDYAHLSLEALRSHRAALQAEEEKVSYWRRIIQARLDVVRAGSVGSLPDHDHLRPVLTDQRVGAGRTALVQVLAVDDIPPLPDLGELWDRRVDEGDPAAVEGLVLELAAAEAQLSSFRGALHQRLGDATGELIARYRDEPALCLSALPLPAPRPGSQPAPRPLSSPPPRRR